MGPEPVLDENGDVSYDLEAHGWVEDGFLGECYVKVVNGHEYMIYMDHRSFFVTCDGYVVWQSGGRAAGNYRPTDEALAWEIDHGIGLGAAT